MAQRRMFSKEITTSDTFVDMPSSSRLLYYDLGMEADDEGFIGNARMLSRAYGASTDDLKLLEAKGFIIIFPSGVTVVKDWNLNNKIRKDRLKPTIYTSEKQQLSIDSKGSYQFGNILTTDWQPNANQMSTKCQPRIGEDRLGKDRIGEDRLGKFSLDEDREEGSPPHENQLQNLADFIQNEFGTITPGQTEELRKLLFEDKFNIDVIKLAVTEASLSNKRSINYVKGILRNWKAEGIETVKAAEQRKSEKFAQPKAPNMDFTIPMDGPWNGK